MTRADEVLARFVAGVDAEQLAAHGVHVLVGDDEARHRWRSDDRENLYSVSKGVCAIAAGIAADAGLIALDSTVGEVLGDTVRVPVPVPVPVLGAGVEAVTLEHLLTMTSGIDFRWFAHQPVPWPDLAQEMLARPTAGPGTVFQYSDASTYVAMRMLARAIGGDVRDWLLPRLFDPLELHNPQWHRCPLGHVMGGSGLELRTDELARIGRLLRDRGLWRGERLLSAEWVDRMLDTRVDTGGTAPYLRYGLAVWAGPGESRRLDGRSGQYVVIDDAHDAVVTITAHEEHRDARLQELAGEALAGVALAG
jgi:CubicO group peptidase (beta-lactamase class C family)